MKNFLALLLASSALCLNLSAENTPKPVDLSVGEYFVNPIGLNLENLSFSWKIPATDKKGAAQTAYQIEVFDAEGKKIHNSGKVLSSESIKIPYEGREPYSRERMTWRVRYWNESGNESEWSNPASFETGLLTNAEWKGSWISTSDKNILKTEKRYKGTRPRNCKISTLPPTYVRREIDAQKEIKSARVYVASRGNFQLYINGEKVGKDFWGTGWTDYDKRIQSNTYNVTDMLNKGKNAIAAVVGAGWYAGRMGWSLNACEYGDTPQILAQLEIVYKDGSSDIIPTDSSWKWSNGAIIYSDIYDGEDYDARMEMVGWNDINFDDSSWKNVAVRKVEKTPLIEPRRNAPVVVKDTLHAISVKKIGDGRYIYDLGQNMVGWARINIPSNAGQKITIRFAEMLKPDGTLYTDNYRTARSTDSYICAKDYGTVTWEPLLTFHGFRYVEISGLYEKPEPQIDWVKGIVAYTDLDLIGSFVCSNPMINQLQSNIQWGQRCNFFEVPTDCPQRDERMGWTGDAQVFCPTAAFNMNVDSFFAKWMYDVRDNQDADGAYPDLAPMKNPKWKGGKAAWGDAGVICPWEIYLTFGDKKILERNYDSMTRYIQYLEKNSDNLIRPEIGYGDWLQPNRPNGKSLASKAMIGTAYFARSAYLASKTAAALGKTKDAKKFASLADRVKDAFAKKYLNEDGTVENDCQTAYLLALGFDLLPESARQKAFDNLVKVIEKDNFHLNTGFVGTPLLNPVLTRFGRTDLAYRLLNNKTFPSWLYPITMGATTMWERWNSYSHETGFADVNMTSFNHYAYGAIGQWLYATVAGLWRDDTIGWKNTVFAPIPGGNITFASASNETPYGRTTSSWKISDGIMEWSITIAPNTVGTVVFPTSNIASVRMDGNKIPESRFSKDGKYPTLKNLPSGEYKFLLRPDKI